MNTRDRIALGAGLGGFGCAGMAVILLCVVLLVVGQGGISWPWGGGLTIKEATGAGVLIVIEREDRKKYAETQLDAMDSQGAESLSALARSKGIFRVLDKDDDVSQDKPEIQSLWKLDRKELPWMYVWKNTRVSSGPLTTEADAIKTAKSYLGN